MDNLFSYAYDKDMFDSHLHLPKQEAAQFHPKQGYSGLMCSSYQEEWEPLQEYLTDNSNLVGAIGLLPQHLDPTGYKDSIDHMQHFLKANPSFQIGEVGLDKRFKAQIDMPTQQAFLSEVLKLASDLNRMVSLHIVDATGLLFEVLEASKTPLPPLLWHGFCADIHTARRFMKFGGMVSLGPSLWKENNKAQKFLDSYKDLPFAIETDWPEGWLPRQWEGLSYQQIYDTHLMRLSQHMNLTTADLEERSNAIGTILTHYQTTGR